MPAKYTLVPHINPNDPEAPPRYYPRVKSSDVIDERGIADEITMMSALTQADMMAAIEALLQVIPRHLGEGRIVRLGDFGSFSLKVEGEPVDDPAEFNASRVRGSRVHFRAGKTVRKMLKKIEYERE